MPKHNHIFVRLYTKPGFGAVEGCLCGEYRTIMFDYSKAEHVYLPGNLLAINLAQGMKAYVICGTNDEFEEMIVQLKEKNGVEPENISRLVDVDQLRTMDPFQPIFFYGTWQEAEVVNSIEFTKHMNGWL